MNRAKPESAGKTAPARYPAGYLAAALVLECVFLLGLAEGFIAWSNLDMRLLGDLLYYQTSDLEVHRLSEDIALHYELTPDTSAVLPEKKKVTVNSLGFRDPPHCANKPAGVTRIVILGGSNTYGSTADVSGVSS